MAIKMRIKELLAVKERRENRRITYEVIIKETGLSPTTIAGYITNRIARYDAKILATWRDYLGCTTGELFIDEPDTEPEKVTAVAVA